MRSGLTPNPRPLLVADSTSGGQKASEPMQAKYESQGGLLVKPGTNECAGYIMNFAGHGAYGPHKIETGTGDPTDEEIKAHNSLLALAERGAMIRAGVGTFYLTKKGKDVCYPASVEKAEVSQWDGSWRSPWCFVRSGHSYGFCYVKTYWVWFTGPDGKKWYGVNKGDMDCFTGRRLKNQK